MSPSTTTERTTRAARRFRRTRRVLLSLLLLLSSPYFLIPHYSFPDRSGFEGQTWYNPYADSDSLTLQSNFHLHSHAWGGLTDGTLENHGIDSIYRSMGYDCVSLSNYFRIDTLHKPIDATFIPCYEHGYSIQKSHRIVLGAHKVNWFDVVTPQTVHIKQFLFNLIKPNADVLVMAHPAFGRPSYTVEDASLLCNYNCMEVLNHYRNSLAHWDSALSAGRPVWIVGDDDSHNAANDHETGVRWTLIRTNSASRDSVCAALRRGSAFGVMGRHGRMALKVLDLRVVNDTLRLRCNMPYNQCRVITQGGIESQRDSIKSECSYALHHTDHYARLEIQTDEGTIYTNPVLLSNSIPVPLVASIDVVQTILWYLAYLLICVGFYYFAR